MNPTCTETRACPSFALYHRRKSGLPDLRCPARGQAAPENAMDATLGKPGGLQGFDTGAGSAPKRNDEQSACPRHIPDGLQELVPSERLIQRGERPGFLGHQGKVRHFRTLAG